VAAGAAGVVSVRRGHGLPHAGHSWFQLVPVCSSGPTARHS